MDLKLKYTADEVDNLFEELAKELDLAKVDYIRKKKVKGEEIDLFKMHNALNQRKKLKSLTKRCLGAIFNVGNLLDKPTINRASEQLEREARSI